MAESLRRSAVTSKAGIAWRVGLPRTRFSLRVDLDAAATRAAAACPIATVPCRTQARGEWSALWLGPDEQLLIGPENEAPALLAAVTEALRGLDYSLVEISHRQGSIEVDGAHAAALINAGCPLDLHELSFPPGACTRTVYAKTEIVLWRTALDRFHIECWRSFMPYLAGLLALAEQEYSG
jgi:sarcosine oxidase, subunit gamma